MTEKTFTSKEVVRMIKVARVYSGLRGIHFYLGSDPSQESNSTYQEAKRAYEEVVPTDIRRAVADDSPSQSAQANLTERLSL